MPWRSGSNRRRRSRTREHGLERDAHLDHRRHLGVLLKGAAFVGPALASADWFRGMKGDGDGTRRGRIRHPPGPSPLGRLSGFARVAVPGSDLSLLIEVRAGVLHERAQLRIGLQAAMTSAA